MIRRTLVPVNVRPVDKDELQKQPQRTTTLLDDRTVVPSQLSKAPPLNGKSSIPAHLPLGVLVNRSLVPRGMEVKPFEKIERASTLPLDILDSRMVVPAEVNPITEEDLRQEEKPLQVTPELREVIEPDIFITGDPNLLIEPEEKRKKSDDALKLILSILFHVAVILFLILSPKMFPSHAPTDEQMALAKRQLQWIYTPPPAPRVPPSPKIHVSPKVLNSVAPPVVQPPAPPVEAPKAPEPPKTAELPPEPKPQNLQQQPSNPPASQLEAVQPPAPRPRPHLNLGLSNDSPGQEIQNQMRDAIRDGRPQGGVYGGGPSGPGVKGPGMSQGYQILSDTQGVDFTSYIQRLLATLQRNWYAIMPESAYPPILDRGVVSTTFQINPDGSIAAADPVLERTSGKGPLDRAAMSAIRASNPFEPLPSAFHGPYLRLRIIFIYNIPPSQVNLQ